MPLTSIERVRAHLNGLRVGEMPVTNVRVVLNGAQYVPLPHSGLVPGSVIVKTLSQGAPVKETRPLTADWVALSHAPLAGETLLVAADDSLGTVFTENTDYLGDYTAGRIRRLVGGGITESQSVVMWYSYFQLYTAGDDYLIDDDQGRLARTASGSIADGQTVLVDYTVSLGAIPDDTIAQAIEEAADAVTAFVDPRYHDQMIPALATGETQWAVSALCRIRAAATLIESREHSAVARSTAQLWLELADRYEQAGHRRLVPFAAPVTSLTPGHTQ